jgi:hypothetical protein
MSDTTARILSSATNSNVVQLPERKFPGIVIQGDSLALIFESITGCLQKAKILRDEEIYNELLYTAQTIQNYLLVYEETLLNQGISLPYSNSIKERMIQNDFLE